MMFGGKKILVTGGTGSFGNAVVRRFLESDIEEIRIFSRDEKKQDAMRKHYNNPKLKFYIGDVRDRDSVDDAVIGIDYIFHAAALKQVPSCEFYPIQAVKTNILGAENVLSSAIENKTKKVIVLSTDKAVYPINAMGLSKALMEKTAIAKSRNVTDHETTICCTRYGNVMASRGSVIPLFIEQIREGRDITITEPEMTRFMMSLEQAVDLVFFAFKNGKNGDTFVQKSPAATISLIAETIKKLMNSPEHKIKVIGRRHGEKLYESLLTKEEMARSIDMGEYYKVEADTRDLNYGKYFDQGSAAVKEDVEYHSHNTRQLDLAELYDMLLNLNEIQDDLREFGVVS